jgi:uncharacterized membrane protein (UPF0182 family)
MVNNQPIEIAPARFIRPIAWLLAIGFGIFSGLAMRGDWQEFASYLNQASTSISDPIFHKPLGFYLFTLPLMEAISSWLTTLAFVILCAALAYSLLAIPGQVLKQARTLTTTTAFAAVSCTLAVFLLALSWRTYLSRFPYLWTDHQTFSGVTYTEANYLLPALFFVSIALIIAAAISILNAFTKRGLRLLILALAIPVAVYIVGVVPARRLTSNITSDGRDADSVSSRFSHDSLTLRIPWKRSISALTARRWKTFDCGIGAPCRIRSSKYKQSVPTTTFQMLM